MGFHIGLGLHITGDSLAAATYGEPPESSTTKVLLHFDNEQEVLKNDGVSSITQNSSVTWSSSNLLFGLGRVTVGIGGYISLKGIPEIGTQDFAMEFQLNMGSSLLLRTFMDFGGTGLSLVMEGGDNFVTLKQNYQDRVVTTTNLTGSVWHAIAISRVAGKTRVFINGTQEGVSWTDTNDYSWHAINGLIVGASALLIKPALCAFDEFRLRIGEGISSNYTPAVGPFPNP